MVIVVVVVVIVFLFCFQMKEDVFQLLFQLRIKHNSENSNPKNIQREKEERTCQEKTISKIGHIHKIKNGMKMYVWFSFFHTIKIAKSKSKRKNIWINYRFRMVNTHKKNEQIKLKNEEAEE